MGHESSKKLLKKDCKVKFQKIFYVLCLMFGSVHGGSASLVNIIEVIQAVQNASSSPSLNPLMPPPATNNILTPTNSAAFYPAGSQCTARFIKVNALRGVAYQNLSVQCASGLSSLTVNLTDADAQNYYVFTFDDAAIFSQTSMTNLLNQGMYIAVNMLINPSGQPAGNYAQVCLTDVLGNVFAQQMSSLLPSGCGFVYANIGFNTPNVISTTSALQSGQTYVNWVPIANGQRVLYQNSTTGTAKTTAPVGGLTVPRSVPTAQIVSLAGILQQLWIYPVFNTGSAQLPIHSTFPTQFQAIQAALQVPNTTLKLVARLQYSTREGRYNLHFEVLSSVPNSAPIAQGIFTNLTDQRGNPITAISSTGSPAVFQTALNFGIQTSGMSKVKTYTKNSTFSIKLSTVPGKIPGATAITPPATDAILTPTNLPEFNPASGSCSTPAFIPINALQGAAYNNAAIACQGGLTSLTVNLTDATGTDFYVFTFDDVAIFSQTNISTLMNQGMYIAVNLLTDPSGQPSGNYAQVCLTDILGNIYAQQMSSALQPDGGFVYANIGFNTTNVISATPALQANQTYVNWVPIANGLRVWYKDIGTLTEATNPKLGLGGTTVPLVAAPTTVSLTGALQQLWITQVFGCGTGSKSKVLAQLPIHVKFPTEFQQIQNALSQASNTTLQVITQLQYAATSFTYNLAFAVYSTNVNSIVVSPNPIASGTFYHLTAHDNNLITIAPSSAKGLDWGCFPTTLNFGVQTSASHLTQYNVSAPACSINLSTVPAKILGAPLITPPASNNILTPTNPAGFNPANGNCSIPAFIPVNALTGFTFNDSAIACQGGLTSLTVNLTDATGTNFYVFTFDNAAIFSQTNMSKLMSQGMYIAVNMLINPSGQPSGNYAQVCLTDILGNVYAQQMSSLLPSGCGFVWANIGFNTPNVISTTQNLQPNQTCLNWVPILHGKRVLYQDTNVSAQTTTPPVRLLPVPAEVSVSVQTISLKGTLEQLWIYPVVGCTNSTNPAAQANKTLFSRLPIHENFPAEFALIQDALNTPNTTLQLTVAMQYTTSGANVSFAVYSVDPNIPAIASGTFTNIIDQDGKLITAASTPLNKNVDWGCQYQYFNVRYKTSKMKSLAQLSNNHSTSVNISNASVSK